MSDTGIKCLNWGNGITLTNKTTAEDITNYINFKIINTLNRTLKIKAYGNYTKRTLIILKYRYLKMLISLYLRDLSNYSNIMEYGSLIKRVSQFYKYYTILLMKITIQNS